MRSTLEANIAVSLVKMANRVCALCLARLLFAESADHTVCNGLHKILDEGTVLRCDHDLRRHAWRRGEPPNTVELLR